MYIYKIVFKTHLFSKKLLLSLQKLPQYNYTDKV